MRRLVGPFLALLMASLLFAGCLDAPATSGGTLTDATGTPVDVSDLSRLVATSHDLVEMLFQLGHGARVVGVPGWIDHPPGPWPEGIEPVDGVPAHLGRPHVLNAEEILAVDPSLVLIKDHPLQPTGLAASLRSVGVPVFVFDNQETVDNIRYTYETLGHILASVDPTAPEQAAAHWRAVDEDLDRVASAVAAQQGARPVALYQLPVGFVAGADTSADVLLRIAGARNLAAEAGLRGYRQISEEVIQEADPERIVVESTAASSPEVFFESPRYAGTTAARRAPHSLLVVDPATTALVGPRFHHGVREVAEWLHPAAFGLIRVDVEVQRDQGDVTVDATGEAAEGPLTFRFDPGDGSEVQSSTDGRFFHSYSTGIYDMTLLVIDGGGRTHEHRETVEVAA